MLGRMVGATLLVAACGSGSDGAPGTAADAGPGDEADAALAVHHLEVDVLGEVPGSVTSADGSIACPPTCTADLAQGTSVELTASPEIGSAFTGWSGACAGDQATCTVDVTGDLAVTASFGHDTRTVTLVRTGPGRGSLLVENWGAAVGEPLDCGDSCSGEFSVGGHLWVTAAPEYGSRAGRWSGCPIVSGIGTCFIDQVSDDMTVTGGLLLGKVWSGNSNDHVLRLAPTADGSLYMIGTFTAGLTFGNISVGGGPGTPPYGFIVKLNAALEGVWAQRISRAVALVTADPAGNAVTATDYIPSSQDWLVQRRAAAGGTTETMAGTGEVHLQAVASDGDGNIAVVGSLEGTSVSGGISISSAGGKDILIGVIDATTWSWIWYRRFGAASYEEAHAVAFGPDGDVWVAGTAYGGGTAGGEVFDVGDIYTAFVARYDGASGDHLESRPLSGSIGALGRAVRVTTAGNVQVVGVLYGTGNFGGDDLEAPLRGALFAVEVDPLGQHVASWATDIGGQDWPSIAFTDDGDVAFATTFGGVLTLPIGSFDSGTTFDMLVGRIDGATGDYEWARNAGGTGSEEEAHALAIDALGRFDLAGDFLGDGDFGVAMSRDIVLVPDIRPP